MSDPIAPLRRWPEGILQASVPANDNSLRNEALSRSCRGVANNVSTPEDGDVYIVGVAPTGNFATFDQNDIALARVIDGITSWYAWAPVDGIRLTMEDGSRKLYVGDSTASWVDEGGGGGSGTVTSVGYTFGSSVSDVLSATGSPITTSGTITLSAVDPNADRIVFWDDSAGKLTHLTVGSGLSITGTTLATSGAGTGDVVGPASATDSAVALFDGTTGKLLKNGITIPQIKQIEQNSQSTAYTLVLADAGKHILHPSADTTARVFTIPANSSVAYPVGTAITFVNQNAAGTITIAITTDTMRLAGAGTTGSRTLAANGVATALKITSTEWIISGTGLT